MTTTTLASDLVGRWDIVSWEQVYDDGRVEQPMGTDPSGFIRYTPDGDMVCLIARGDRADFTSGGQWDATEAELAGAYRSMLAYSGRYTVADGGVTHHVEISLFPNWQGGTQRRSLRFGDDGTVALDARLEEDTAEARTARLVWRRHNADTEGAQL